MQALAAEARAASQEERCSTVEVALRLLPRLQELAAAHVPGQVQPVLLIYQYVASGGRLQSGVRSDSRSPYNSLRNRIVWQAVPRKYANALLPPLGWKTNKEVWVWGTS